LSRFLQQTYPNFEYIILDDASTDNTYSICKAYAATDSRIKLFKLTESTGVSNARNQAITHVQTELVAFLDSDDIWHSTFLEQQIYTINSQTESDCVGTFCSSYYIDSSAKKITGFFNIQQTKYFLPKMLTSFSPPGNGSALLIRTDALKKSGQFEERFISGGDFEMWLRILSQDLKRYFIGNSRKLVYYRQHNQNISSRYPKARSKTIAYCIDKYLPLVAEKFQINSITCFSLAEAKAGQYKSAICLARKARMKWGFRLLMTRNGIKTYLLSFLSDR
jgi:glycosyltransferase involved in cell wall biosynthesis